MQKEFTLKNFRDFKKAVSLLAGSVKKYKPYNPKTQYTPKQMEYYDALSFRYEKTVEVALYFFRSLESYLYSAESDTLRNRLLTMEKLGIICSAEKWLEVRLLRNRVAHAYLPAELKAIYAKIVKFSTYILADFPHAEEYVNKP
ncbi:MAG TPA: hypothetical protein DCL44_10890 [Elusimicrobia bacterium]|nr:hypothetical protein [Elusimicrobiota bacterium]